MQTLYALLSKYWEPRPPKSRSNRSLGDEMGTNEPSADAVEQTPVVQQTSQTEQEESQLVGMQTLCYEVSPGGRSAPARLGSEALSEAAPSTPDRKTCGEEEVLDGYLAWTLGAELPKTVSPLLLCSPEYSPSVVRTDHSGMEKAPGDDADQDHELLQLQESLNQLEPLASISCCFSCIVSMSQCATFWQSSTWFQYKRWVFFIL